jgi:hypothetical protein
MFRTRIRRIHFRTRHPSCALCGKRVHRAAIAPLGGVACCGCAVEVRRELNERSL